MVLQSRLIPFVNHFLLLVLRVHGLTLGIVAGNESHALICEPHLSTGNMPLPIFNLDARLSDLCLERGHVVLEYCDAGVNRRAVQLQWSFVEGADG